MDNLRPFSTLQKFLIPSHLRWSSFLSALFVLISSNILSLFLLIFVFQKSCSFQTKLCRILTQQLSVDILMCELIVALKLLAGPDVWTDEDCNALYSRRLCNQMWVGSTDRRLRRVCPSWCCDYFCKHQSLYHLRRPGIAQSVRLGQNYRKIRLQGSSGTCKVQLEPKAFILLKQNQLAFSLSS